MYEEPQAEWYFEAETAAAALGYVYYYLGVFPVFVLVGSYVKVVAANISEEHIGGADLKFAFYKAHGLGAVAATAALVKHEWTVGCSQLLYECQCGFGGGDFLY